MARYIDADALIKDMRSRKYIDKALCEIFETIVDNAPTAYDVEAVVAKLEKEKEIHTEHFRTSLYKDYPEIKQMYEKVCLVIDKAISIVRGKE